MQALAVTPPFSLVFMIRYSLILRGVVVGLLLAPTWAAMAADRAVQIRLAPNLSSEPITGRLYLFVSKRTSGEPMRGPSWFSPEPFFRKDVRGITATDVLTIDDAAAGFPVPLSKLPPGKYHVQAVLDHDFDEPAPANGVGNFYCDPTTWDVADEQAAPPTLELNRVVLARPFPKSRWVEEVELRSELLTRFHQRDIVERAAVVLPASYYEHPDRRYPVIYSIPGFGGDHRAALRYADKPPEVKPQEAEFIRVFLSGRCKWGHHVYADSATNGPRGECLIRELIPHINRTYRTVNAATARFVTGHSSGGWSSLWLQVTYPETFGGVWSSAPDPVDFRDFQEVNLYAEPPLSLYVDRAGARRPIARRGQQVALWYESFAHMDDVLERGGQLRSFEAVFSPLAADGLPARLWDRRTGEIDPAIAQAWQSFDIRLQFERNWDRLRPLLAGKLHLTVGTLDTFYLNGSTALLAERLQQLGSDAVVTLVPGADHGSLLTTAYRDRIVREMSACYWKHQGEQPAGN